MELKVQVPAIFRVDFGGFGSEIGSRRHAKRVLLFIEPVCADERFE
jgi:hypothetical protein